MAQLETDTKPRDIAQNGVAVLLAVIFGGLAALWVFWAESLLDLGLLAALAFAAAYGFARYGRFKGGVMKEVFDSNDRTEKKP